MRWFIKGKIEVDNHPVTCYVDMSEEYIYPTLFMEYFRHAPKTSILDSCNIEKSEDDVIELLRELGQEYQEINDDNQEEETEEKFTSD